MILKKILFDHLICFTRKIDVNIFSENGSSSNYNEAAVLRAHFKANKFDYVSKIFSSSITLTFRDEAQKDTVNKETILIGNDTCVHTFIAVFGAAAEIT